VYQTLEIGSAPADEECQPCNIPGANYDWVKAECLAYIHQLKRQFGNPPPETDLVTQFTRDGDYGYYEVVVKWRSEGPGIEPGNPSAVEYAYKLEANTPQFWDAQALAELNIAGVPIQTKLRADTQPPWKEDVADPSDRLSIIIATRTLLAQAMSPLDTRNNYIDGFIGAIHSMLLDVEDMLIKDDFPPANSPSIIQSSADHDDTRQ
jgi:hypothetical protein